MDIDVTKDGLFRDEAVAAAQPQWLGTVRLALPASQRLWGLIALAIVVLMTLWLFLGHYTRREHVVGRRLWWAAFSWLLPLLMMVPSQAWPISMPQTASGAQWRPGDPLPLKNCSKEVRDMKRELARLDAAGKLSMPKMFRQAALEGDSARITSLYARFNRMRSKGAGPWAKDGHREFDMHWALDGAVRAQQLAAIDRLIQLGADPQFTSDVFAVPAVSLAAECGNLAALRELAAAGASLTQPLQPGSARSTAANTPLELAVALRQQAVVVWLMKQGVYSCTQANVRRMRTFITKPQAGGVLSDDLAARLLCTDSIDESMHELIGKANKPRTCLDRASTKIAAFKRESTSLTLEQKFRLATLEGDVATINRLAPELPGGKRHYESGVKRLKAAVDRREILQLALDDAALAGNVDMVGKLVTLGADPNVVTKYPSNPAVMVAARCGRVKVLSALYEAGADVSLPTFFSLPTRGAKNAIEIAVYMHQDAAVDWLLQHGANACRGNAPKRIGHFVEHGWYLSPPLHKKTIAALRCPAHRTSGHPARAAGQ